MKTCSKCSIERGLSEFPKDRNRKDGRYPQCKECRRESSAKYREEHREKINARRRQWSKANPDAERAHGARYRAANKGKTSVRGARYYAANRAKINERISKYRAENPEDRDKARARNAKYRSLKMNAVQGSHYPTYQEMVDFYGTNCLVPGCQSDPMDRTIDHIVALANGGANGLWNLQPLCKFHNCSKWARHSTDYRTVKWCDRVEGLGDVIYRPYERSGG